MTRVLACAIAFGIAACSGERNSAESTSQTPASATMPPPVVTALAVARGIDQAPGKVDSILAAHGLSAAGFDSLMYRIAGDSAMRAAFAEGRR